MHRREVRQHGKAPQLGQRPGGGDPSQRDARLDISVILTAQWTKLMPECRSCISGKLRNFPAPVSAFSRCTTFKIESSELIDLDPSRLWSNATSLSMARMATFFEALIVNGSEKAAKETEIWLEGEGLQFPKQSFDGGFSHFLKGKALEIFLDR